MNNRDVMRKKISAKKRKRILELEEEYNFDYFSNQNHKETIEILLEDEFPDEIDRMGYAGYDNPPDNSSEQTDTLGYWIFGIGIAGLLIYLFWEVFVLILVTLGVIVFLGLKFLGILFAGIGGSSSSGSSYSAPEHETYGLQRSSGATWQTIAQGPENWMIDKMYQNRAKDGARYRVVKLINGKPSGTTYS